MKSVWQDARYTLRSLLRSPAFTAVAVLSLALGIGVNTVMFTVINGVLLRHLPYPHDEQLAAVISRSAALGGSSSGATQLEFVRLRKASTVSSVGAYYGGYFPNYISFRDPNNPRRFRWAVVTPDLFPTLGIQPLLGRTFLASDLPSRVPPGQTPPPGAVVLSYSIWQSQFGGNPGLLNTMINLGGNPYVVVGVMPKEFQLPVDLVSDDKTELWMPLRIDETNPFPTGRALSVVVRLRAGRQIADLESEVGVLVGRLRQEQPKAYPEAMKQSVNAIPLREDLVGAVRETLLLLMGAVALVLLIACVNVANLLLTHATARRREMALRATLGAGRARLVRQMLTESVLLALFAAALGLLLAHWGLRFILAITPTGALPRAAEVLLDWHVLLFTVGISLLAALLFGSTPAFQASRLNLNTALREDTRSGMSGRARQRLRSALVVAEVTLAFVLVIGAGLLLRGFTKLTQVDPGFNTHNMLTARVSLPIPAYPTNDRAQAYFRNFREKMKSLLGVIDASGVDVIPLNGPSDDDMFEIEGRPPVEQSSGEAAFPHLNLRIVLPGYFEVMQMRLVRGRFFNEADHRSDSALAAVINDTFAKRFFPSESPVGKRIRYYLGPDKRSAWVQIVGVVADGKLRDLAENAQPEVFEPAGQVPALFGSPNNVVRIMSLLVKFDSPAMSTPAVLRQTMKPLDPMLGVFNVEPVDAVVSRNLARPRFNASLLTAFGVAAFLLAVVGIYGLISYSVLQRTREIGIRMALGAQRGNILKLIVGQGALLATVGVGLGLAVAVALTRVMGSLLYGVTPTDVLTFAAVTVLLIAVALLASYLPARRAASVDPLTALRVE